MKESTDFFNETAAKDNADALEKIKASGKVEVHVLTPEERQAWIAKLMPVHTEMQSRFGKDFIEQVYKASGFTPALWSLRAREPRDPAVLDRILDRLEEWIIATLIAAATCLTFVAVVHRYGASNSAALAFWAKAHGALWLSAPAELRLRDAHLAQSVLGAGACHLHVRVDGEVRRGARRAHRHPCRRRRARRSPRAFVAQAGDRVRAPVRRVVHRRHRHPRRDLCL